MHAYIYIPKVTIIEKRSKEFEGELGGFRRADKEKKRKIKQECWFDNLLSF